MAYLNTTASAQVKTGPGTLLGIIFNSHSSGTFRFNDGTSGDTSAGVKATGVLTSSGVFQNNETVTIDDVVYTFKTTLTGAAYEVLIGANAAASLDNLKSAINATAGEGSTYGTGTLAHDRVTATTNTDTTQTVEALYVGTYANSYVTTETCANVAWGAGTLASGAEPSILMINTYTPAAGSGTFMFGEGIDFNTGLYFTGGGTADATIIYK